MKRRAAISGLLLLMILSALPVGCRKQGTTLTLGGGPTGGTFQNFAVALAQLINRDMPGVSVKAQHSGGSVDNLIEVERSDFDMGLVYAGDAFLGRKGGLRPGMPLVEKARALARLYGGAAQLVVRQSSSIRSPRELQRRRIAIGNPGSGSALAAQRFFLSLGIWEDIIPVHVGFDMGLEELRRGSVDAVWMVVGFPNRSILKFTQEVPVRLLDLIDANAAPFFKAYPFYTAARIPAGTYSGQERDVSTFQDAVLWIANQRVNEEFVYRALNLLFSGKGLALMRSADPAAADLSEGKGVLGVTIPLHPGAERFWRERGIVPGG